LSSCSSFTNPSKVTFCFLASHSHRIGITLSSSLLFSCFVMFVFVFFFNFFFLFS
jgi:hypothetical protein